MSLRRLLITTGDPDGIGFEITAKALSKLRLPKGIQLLFFRNPDCEKKHLGLIKKKHSVFSTPTLEAALKIDPQLYPVVEILDSKNPALCFEEGVVAAKNKRIHAIVTAPLSKELIQMAGLSDRGHTDIIRRHLPENNKIYMAFIGQYFSLMLATDHIPLSEVPRSLNKERLEDLIASAHIFMKSRKLPKSRQHIAVLGLNPHAGEIKNLGYEERNIIFPAVQSSQKSGIPVVGPLVPDVAFRDKNFKQCGLFIAMYHDQGLIPFKFFHKKNHGVQVSLNTPFVRISVDHGTAKDIYGKNKADPSSMIASLKLALSLI